VVGGMAPLGYDTKDRKISVNEAEAEQVRSIFSSYLRLGSLNLLMAELRKHPSTVKPWIVVQTIWSRASFARPRFARPADRIPGDRYRPIGSRMFPADIGAAFPGQRAHRMRLASDIGLRGIILGVE
jgi:hypothetical protein